MDYKLISVIITAVITIVLFFFLHFIISPFNRRNELRKEKLKELYGPLYYLILTHRKNLKADMEIKEHEIGDNEPPYIERNPVIEGFEKVIPEVEKLISKNIHLLSYEDAIHWHSYIKANEQFQTDSDKEDASENEVLDLLVDSHQEFINFLDEAKVTYYKLYHQFYGINYLKFINTRFKKRKVNINSNPFYSEEEKLIKIERLHQQEEKILNHYESKRM
ncbi:hypothetical protein [Oceanobacillus salinisoli]|uniref:hypothetical protein n=1 Tax=Oceanobacillus salinisoli TaxID=2678611 RepID=UPI0012E10E13|nr:hypothetical protein [Oceanobacillus salinisoli]